jgi:hypothetical protein
VGYTVVSTIIFITAKAINAIAIARKCLKNEVCEPLELLRPFLSFFVNLETKFR